MTSSNGIEDVEMSDQDGENVVTMMDVLKEQQDLEEDANAVLGASDDKNCTYPMGYIKRQALYACMTCCSDAIDDPSKRAGVCLACSLKCHEDHDLVELYTKRNFRCDCGNPKFNSHPCQFTPSKKDLNEENKYNQNFSGLYCICHRPYPDPEVTDEDEMIQCIICEDWLHSAHLEATVPDNNQYSEMICKKCMQKNEFLNSYSDLIVNSENDLVDIVDVSINGSSNADKNDLLDVDITTTEGQNKSDSEINVELLNCDNSGKEVENKESDNKNEGQLTNNINENGENTDDNQLSEVPTNDDGQNVVDKKESSLMDNLENIESENNEEPNTKKNESEEAITPLETHIEVNKETALINNLENIEPDNKDTHPAHEVPVTNENPNIEVASSSEEIIIGGTKDTSSIDNLETKEKETEKVAKLENEQNGDFLSEDNLQMKKDCHKELLEESAKENNSNETIMAENTKPNNLETEKKEEVLPENNKIESSEENALRTPEELERLEEEKLLADSTDNLKESVTSKMLDKNYSEANEMEVDIKSAESGEKINIDKTVPDEISLNNELPVDSNNAQEKGNNTETPQTSTNVDESEKPEIKRKLSDKEQDNNINNKKQRLDSKPCTKPKINHKKYKGATFWPAHFRQQLCTCNECLSMYKDLSVLFLIDPEDTVSAYESLGKEKTNGRAASEYEKGLQALSSLDRTQQINALTEYNKMRDKLLDFLKSFKDRKEVVKEEDIKAFFAGMKPKREPDGVYFCR